MPQAPDHALKTDAALALFQPIVDRLDRDHAPEGQLVCETLRRLRRSQNTAAADLDPRLEPHVALMRQAFAREAAAPAGVMFQSWSDLHNHLRFAYVPAGRALLAFHSEAAIAQPAMDALMLGIGVTSILQEAPHRLRLNGQIMVPAQWFPSGSAIDTWLRSPKRNPALDTAYGNGLARLDEMLNATERGLPAIHNEGLRGGAKASLFLMRRLRQRLSQRTPNIRPVAVSFIDRLLLRWRVGR